MNTYKLKAISLLDGRNYDKVSAVSDYFSEWALMRMRIRIEVTYLIFISEQTKLIRKLSKKEKDFLHSLWKNFSEEDGLKIKEIEKKINHDVKAVEYFLKSKLSDNTLSDVSNFLHFGLTSYDVNIPSYALMLAGFRDEVMLPKISQILEKLKALIGVTKSLIMLGRTHGQPALPTTMGKEIAVYYSRILTETKVLKHTVLEAKLTGAVGNYNALHFASPQVDWIGFSEKFITSLGLKPNIITTQIIPYDSWIRMFDSVRRLNNIFNGFSQDIWWYISFDYFLQKKKEEEVGSSTMSHKINPITFENAEGNLGLANSLFEFFAKKLSYSRLQRDLSDSTVKRDFGLAFGFTLLAYDSLLSGLSRIQPNKEKMKKDLEGHWEIFSEGIQTFLRLGRHYNAYELLKEKTRGRVMDRKTLYSLIELLPLNSRDKAKLKIAGLDEYLGLAEKLAMISIKEEL